MPECEALILSAKTQFVGEEVGNTQRNPRPYERRRDFITGTPPTKCKFLQRTLSQTVLGVMTSLAGRCPLGIKVGIGAVLWAQFRLYTATSNVSALAGNGSMS